MFFEVKEMKFMEKAGLFVLGGGGYVLLELLWPGTVSAPSACWSCSGGDGVMSACFLPGEAVF